MTVQDIQEIGFSKAMLGGYDMKSVDSFLEKVAEEFAAMQKENAELKAKMKVLVSKIEEYRGVEDGMRRTLMSAQTIAQDTIEKAKREAEQILEDAREESDGKIASVRDQLALEKDKLETAKKQTLEFVAQISSLYQAQAKSLVDMAKAEKLMRADGQPTSSFASKSAVSSPSLAKTSPPQQPVSLSASLNATPLQSAPNPAALAANDPEAPLKDATHRFDVEELKFGANYDPKKA